MKLLYPASNQISTLSDAQLALKIARHSPCAICDNCVGLKPPPDVDLILDESNSSSLGTLTQYGSDDDEVVTDYVETCICGHDVKDHGGDVTDLAFDEFQRRGRAAIRLDEILQVRFFFHFLYFLVLG